MSCFMWPNLRWHTVSTLGWNWINFSLNECWPPQYFVYARNSVLSKSFTYSMWKVLPCRGRTIAITCLLCCLFWLHNDSKISFKVFQHFNSFCLRCYERRSIFIGFWINKQILNKTSPLFRASSDWFSR